MSRLALSVTRCTSLELPNRRAVRFRSACECLGFVWVCRSFQAICMFLGEALCYLAFRVQLWRSQKSETAERAWLLRLHAGNALHSAGFVVLLLGPVARFQPKRSFPGSSCGSRHAVT